MGIKRGKAVKNCQKQIKKMNFFESGLLESRANQLCRSFLQTMRAIYSRLIFCHE